MNDKTIFRIILISGILIVLLFFAVGFIVGRRTDRNATKEIKSTINKLEITVGELNTTVESAKIEYNKLEQLYKQDRESIKQLRDLFEKQGELITEIERRSTEITESGDAITTGIGYAIETVDDIIKRIEEQDD